MNWFINFLTSSIGRKLIMSLTGLFLVLFLVVHLIGNLQLLYDDGGEAFNLYAYFMTHNPLIKTVSYGLYFFILLHAFQGIALWRKNRAARGGERYAVQVTRAVNTNASVAKGMAWIGIIIFIFLVLHLYQFWFQMHWGEVGMVTYGSGGMAESVKDLYTIVKATYADILYVIIYVISMIVVGMHLWHGFQSSFQTLGINHKKYSPLIHFLGKALAIGLSFGFAIIPILMYLNQ